MMFGAKIRFTIQLGELLTHKSWTFGWNGCW